MIFSKSGKYNVYSNYCTLLLIHDSTNAEGWDSLTNNIYSLLATITLLLKFTYKIDKALGATIGMTYCLRY